MKILIDIGKEICKVEEHISALRKNIEKEEVKLSCLKELGSQNAGEMKESDKVYSDWEPVYKMVRRILLGRSRPCSTRMLVLLLQRREVLIPFGDKKLPHEALSTRLSSRDEFVSHGREGWMLKKNEEAKTSSFQ